MPVRLTYVTRFIKFLTERRFTEAEKMFNRLSEKTEENDWNKGYLRALYGMFLTEKSNDKRYAFLFKINLEDKKELQQYCEEFSKYANNSFHPDYDRGFFSAWNDYIRILLRTKKRRKQKKGK